MRSFLRRLAGQAIGESGRPFGHAFLQEWRRRYGICIALVLPRSLASAALRDKRYRIGQQVVDATAGPIGP